MEDFAAKVIAAHQAGLSEARQQKQFEQEQQLHKLRVDAANLDLKKAKFDQQIHELALNPNPVAPEAQVAAPQPSMAPIQTSLTDSSQTETPAAPPSPATQSIPLPLPPRYVEGLNGPVAVPTVSHQQAVAATIAQHLQDIKLAAIKAGAEEQAKTAVTAPLTATEQAPGGQTLVGRGTPSEHIVPGPPAKVEPPKVSPETVTINGQGPHIALRWEQNGVVKWLDPNTGGPIQGKVDAYERPRETAPPEELPTVDELTRTTISGNPYVDVTKYTGKAKNAAVTAAIKAGLPVPSEKEITQLNNMDAARLDAQYMAQQLDSKLAKDATGRIISGADNIIGKFAQTDPILGAVGSFQSAAARQILALGATGRLNPTLLEVAIKNDIPQITDTVAVAQQRVKNLQKFFDDAERSILGAGKGGTNVTVTIKKPDGTTGTIPRANLPAALKLGAVEVK